MSEHPRRFAPEAADDSSSHGGDTNREQIKEFLQVLSAQAKRALRGLENPGFSQISRLHPTDKKLVPTRYKLDDVTAMIERAITDSETGFNVYIEGRTIRGDLGSRRGELRDTVAVFALVIDSDADKGMAWKSTLQPSVTVETSPGNFQYWFFLREAVNAEVGKALGERIRASANTDHDTGTVTQPYRIAGTINYPTAEKKKRGRVVVPTRLIEVDSILWTPEDIKQAFPPLERKSNGNGGAHQHPGGCDERDIPAELVSLIREGTELGQRSSKFFHAVAWLKQLGWTIDGITRLFEKYPDGIAQKYEGRVRSEVERAYDKVEHRGPVDKGVTLDDFHAYMPMHTYIFAPSREPWPASSVNARFRPVPLVDKAGRPVLDGSGNQKTVKASLWLDQNRPIEQMTWAPGLPELIANRLVSEGGWIDRTGVSCFNLYLPPIIVPGNAAEAKPWLDHVHKVFGGDADHIVKYLSHRVQRPQEKVNHALVLGGAQGIGKDTLLEPAKHAVGPWNFAEVSPQQMLGRFNGFLKSVILRISEARDLGETNRFSFYDHMKAYTAAPPDVLRVDEKNLREHSSLNCCGVIITTNHKTDGIYLPSDDRRHFVAWSDLTKDDFVDGYWNAIWDYYARGGYRHVAAYLGELDITSFDPKAPPPKTPAFWDIVDANRAPEEAELADALEKIGNPDATTIIRIKSEAQFDLSQWLGDRKNRRAIPHRMEKCGYFPVRNDAAQDGLWKIDGTRQVIYAKSTLTTSERLKAARELTK